MKRTEDPADVRSEELRRLNEDAPIVCPECMGDAVTIRLRIGPKGDRMRCVDCGHEFDAADGLREEWG